MHVHKFKNHETSQSNRRTSPAASKGEGPAAGWAELAVGPRSCSQEGPPSNQALSKSAWWELRVWTHGSCSEPTNAVFHLLSYHSGMVIHEEPNRPNGLTLKT